jgi:hypothetical protein
VKISKQRTSPIKINSPYPWTFRLVKFLWAMWKKRAFLHWSRKFPLSPYPWAFREKRGFSNSYCSPYPWTFRPISLDLSPHIPGPFAPYPWTFHPISLDPSVEKPLSQENLQPHKTLKTLKTIKTTTGKSLFVLFVVVSFFHTRYPRLSAVTGDLSVIFLRCVCAHVPLLKRHVDSFVTAKCKALLLFFSTITWRV